jgi:serine protease Do
MHSKFHSPSRLMALSVLVLFSLTVMGLIGLDASTLAETTETAQTDEEIAAAVSQAKSLSTAFRSAAGTVIPAVVQIKVHEEIAMSGAPSIFSDPSLGGRFAPPSSLGSGVILDSEGVILTNNHVVEAGERVMVELADGRQFEAQEILVDPKTDLAVIRVETDEPLPFAEIGDSDRLDIGDWVLAIGSPFDLDLTVSAGIISAKGRSLGPTQRANFLQTDAAINPGNSGGPLINLDGQVIGINTAIASRSGGYQGIGFAIPSNMAQWVVTELLENGEVRRAYLGVSIAPITVEVARSMGVPINCGVLVERLFPGAPADQAGLLRSDIIVSFDGHPVRSANDLQGVVEQSPVDEPHSMDIIRASNEMTLAVDLAAMPEDFGTMNPPAAPSPSLQENPESKLDMKVGWLLLETGENSALPLDFGGKEGLLIMDVSRNSPAFEAGVRTGSLLVEIDGQSVTTLKEYESLDVSDRLAQGVTVKLITPNGEVKIELSSN